MDKSSSVLGWIIAVIVLVGIIFYFVFRGGVPAAPAVSTPETTVPTAPSNSPQPVVVSPEPGAPHVVSNSVVATSDTTGTVAGTIIPEGALTTYWYEYGGSPTLGKRTTTQTIGSGYATIPTPGYITGLVSNSTYYFRVVASNQYGMVNGPQYTFQTTQGNPAPTGSAPSVKSLAAGSVSRTTVNVNGQVTPNGADTQYWFEYGKTASLGNTTAFAGIGNGTSMTPISLSLSNLDPASTYYFRINAENQFGTVNGAILNFKTLGPPAATAPAVTTRSAVSIGTSTVTFRGTVNPLGAETAYWFEYSRTPFSSGTAVTQSTNRETLSGPTDSTSATQVSMNVSGLTSNATYYVRAAAQNSVGTTRGDSVTFVTK